MSRTTNILGAFLIGAAAGGAIALLTAPNSGKETRHKLRELTTGGYLKVLDSAERRLSSAAARARMASDRTRELRDNARQAIEAARQAVAESKSAYRREMRKRA